ncbi:unnamed protein product [Rangifer tarandus platyrhynchus]|uniref:Uncharacterized protein n=2 Tax=Rangifer tarandus platyrhynchus TaxID=3082113 RepID=A0ABN8Z6T8_RANTA|nr:unnamed protein product [Rangifer tarandus platyrhynchus]
MRQSRTVPSFSLSKPVRELADSGLAPMSPFGNGVIRICFSGTPLLPPVSSRLRTIADVESRACVVFNIEAGGNEVTAWPQLHGLCPARLLCTWDFPGKNTGVQHRNTYII